MKVLVKVLVFDNGKLIGEKDWTRPDLNQRRSELLRRNPEAFSFLRGLRTRVNKTDSVNPRGGRMALNYLNLLLSPKYMVTAAGAHQMSHLSDRKRIVEALRQKSPLTLDELAWITHLRKISVQYLVTKLRRGGKLGYAQGSNRTCPKFCLPTDPLFLGCSEDRKSFSYEAILGAFEEEDSLTVNRLVDLTGFSPQMCRVTLRKMVSAGEIVICGKAGEHRFSANVYAINQETRNRA